MRSQSKIEKALVAWLEDRKAKEQRVSHPMVFRMVLDLDLKFWGGVKSDGYLERLKKWF